MAKQFRHWYTVRGSGEFPVDMLRYDSSYPATEVNSHIAEGEQDHLGRVTVRPAPRAVTLERIGPKDWTPSVARWESFGWRVDADVLSVEVRT